MKIDPAVATTQHVKETRFFLGQISQSEHDALFDERSHCPRVEFDTALCSNDAVPARLKAYGNGIRTGLVLREPAAFAVSRYIHSRRKGEYAGMSLDEVFRESDGFRVELDYAAIMENFSDPQLRLQTWAFEAIAADAESFYRTVRHHLAGVDLDLPIPSLSGPINQARNSTAGRLPAVLSSAATAARARGLHSVVEFAKSVGIHRTLERSAEGSEVEQLRKRAQSLVERNVPSSIECWRTLGAEPA